MLNLPRIEVTGHVRSCSSENRHCALVISAILSNFHQRFVSACRIIQRYETDKI